ncbi:MAG: hypothetical protein NTW10_08650, partial [Bacteroidetes bacterium]|nr:hypothetical protein [Bacteroidota bacterium]
MRIYVKGFLLFLMLALIASTTFAGKKVVKLGVSEPDAKISLDGKIMGSGQLDIVVLSNTCVNVKIEKVGFLTERMTFCYKSNYAPPPKTYYVEMKK